MSTLRETSTFNQIDRFARGWYWALPSHELAKGQVKSVHLLGRELVLYRGEDGRAVAMDAYCPHMGAHLAEGRVEGNALRCFFHDWKFSADGTCLEVPCLPRPPKANLTTWPTGEKYGLVWVWTGEAPERPLPYVPELKDEACDAKLGARFIKNCHPNVVLINAIDEQHFNSVHDLPVDLSMAAVRLDGSAQTFSNTTKLPDTNVFTRSVQRLYAGPLTYSMCYHFGSTGTVTVGPDLMHFHIMFALRMVEGGRTEGQTVLITRRRDGLFGQAWNRVALELTKVVGDYFAKGDTQVFQTMKFDFRTPTKADHAIIEFIQHVEQQPALRWGEWSPVEGEVVQIGRGGAGRERGRVMGRLTARVVPVASVSEAQRREMFSLLEQYYDAVEHDRFSADLSAKDDVILLEDGSGAIRGFSTLKNLDVELDGELHHGLFSGDTVVDKNFWGQRVLGQAFLRYLFVRKARHPFRPFWWFLITKGYKTYLLMANNFADHYPNCARETPALERRILDAFGSSLFAEAYDAKTGLISFGRSLGQVKCGVADITSELLGNPKIAFFQARNPGWASGTELACVARMTWSMPLYYGMKALWKTRAAPRGVASPGLRPAGESR